MADVRRFEWDEAKALSNLGKHGVTFAYATAVFLDPRLADIDASRADQGETRQKAIGAVNGQLLTPVYTVRGKITRIISARRSNASERTLYGPLRT